MGNLGQMDDAFFDAWQDALLNFQNDVQRRLSTMLQRGELLSRDAILTSVDLCQNMIDDLESLESNVGPDFPLSNRLEYVTEILYDVVINILTTLEAMFDKICSQEKEQDKKRAIHQDHIDN